MKALLSLIFFSFSLMLFSIPAKKTPYEYTQPNGEVVVLMANGDEYLKFQTTVDGYQVAKNEDGFFYFVSGYKSSGEVILSDYIASNAENRDSKTVAFLATIKESLQEARVARRANTPMYKTNGQSRASSSKSLPAKGLILLVEFADTPFASSTSKDNIVRMFNEKGFSDSGANGSIKEYYEASSNGVYAPQFDLYGPYTLPKNMAYYGANDSYGDDVNPRQMVIDACTLADADVDFSEYSTDGSAVDFVYIIFAGYNEAENSSLPNLIWPHKWSLANRRTIFDNRVIYDYACSSELYDGPPAKKLSGMGTFCHEFSHLLGLPDLYNTSTGSDVLDSWTLMSSGNYLNDGHNPPLLNLYERELAGFSTIEEINTPQIVKLNNSFDGYRINTKTNNEFYVVEYRKNIGWDSYLPNTGMLIYHIDRTNTTVWNNNTVNNTSNHPYFNIVKASSTGSLFSYSTMFPGSKNITSFTDTSTASSRTMKSWAGVNTEKPITEIKLVDGVLSFNFMNATNNKLVSKNSDILVYQDMNGIVYVNTKKVSGNIEVRNSLGHLILSQTNQGNNSIDISSYPRGVYFIKLDENKEVWKILK